jgi:hypothetical protein
MCEVWRLRCEMGCPRSKVQDANIEEWGMLWSMYEYVHGMFDAKRFFITFQSQIPNQHSSHSRFSHCNESTSDGFVKSKVKRMRGYAIWNVMCELWDGSVGWEVSSVNCEMWNVRCEVWCVRCEVWGVRCKMWGVRCEVRVVIFVRCEVCCVRCVLVCDVWGVCKV